MPAQATEKQLVRLPPLHPAQSRVAKSASRFNVVACGRRWGKTKLGQHRLFEAALLGKPVAWFSPTYKMLADVFREMRQTLHPLTSHINAQEHRIQTVRGGVIDMWSLDTPDSARGRKYARIVIDEAAMIPKLGEAWQAVIRPTLTDYRGDAWLLSTPKGRNFFWQSFERGNDSTLDDWRCWQMPTVANPFIDPAEVEQARKDLPDRVFRQEYLAEFLDDGGGVFRFVAESASADPQDEAIPGHQYVIGADWGRSNDYTVFTVIDQTIKEVVRVDRSNQVEYSLQRARLLALAQKFRPALIIAEVNSMGQPIIEQLQRDNLPVWGFTTTNATKAKAVDDLALAFEQGNIKILNNPILISELQAYEGERLPSGLIRYSAPEGMHDDCVMSLLMGWQGAIRGSMGNAY